MFNGNTAKDFLSSRTNMVAYAKRITKAVMRKSKVLPFIARSEEDDNAIIKAVVQTVAQGNSIGITFSDELLEAGARGNVSFAASKEEMLEIKQFIKVDSMQHSVPSTEEVTLPERAKKFKSTALEKLQNWGVLWFDKIIISAFTANCTNIVAAGHHSDGTTGNIATTDILSLADIEEAKRRAELGVAYNAAGEEIQVPPLVPFKTEQNENAGFYEELPSYIVWLGTNSTRNIKKDPNYKEARRDAMERGKKNPLFTGALGYWDGVLLLAIGSDTKKKSGILSSKSDFNGFSNVKRFDLSTYKGSGDQEVELNLMLGSGAGTIVVDQGFNYYDWADKDDPTRMHAGTRRIFGFAKTKYSAADNDDMLADNEYNGKDFGVILIAASTGEDSSMTDRYVTRERVDFGAITFEIGPGDVGTEIAIGELNEKHRVLDVNVTVDEAFTSAANTVKVGLVDDEDRFITSTAMNAIKGIGFTHKQFTALKPTTLVLTVGAGVSTTGKATVTIVYAKNSVSAT